MAEEKRKGPPPHIPRGQVPRGRIVTGQIEIVAPPGAENAVKCPKCGTAMNWDPGLNQWYCQTCMVYHSP